MLSKAEYPGVISKKFLGSDATVVGLHVVLIDPSP